MTTSYKETVTKFKKILNVDDDDLFVMLEEGRLAGALISTLKDKGMRATPSMKNSVEKAVKSLEKDTTARDDPEPELLVQETPQIPGMDMLAGEMTITIMFTDVVGSTAMNQRLGDQKARQVMRAHDELVRNHTKVHSGVEVKSMGDGFMLTFPSAKRAVSAGIAMQKELISPGFPFKDTGLAIRMGMTVGEPIREEQDLFGMSVVVAARIGAKAVGGQILTSQIVHDLLSDAGDFKFDPAGEHQLKGVGEPQKLYEINWRQE
ncbi:MAG: adenylate/guanylate cyclase domain-containing protein [SAR202 cluster bacterium]|nr:adenylate/guanylate cyclase domain-containing protein [SAR202 cluster bacterium]